LTRLQQILGIIDAKPEDAARLEQSAGPETVQAEFRILHRDGDYRWVSLQGVRFRGVDGGAIRSVRYLCDITSEKTIDSLTGLANELAFLHRVEAAIQARRDKATLSFAILLFDVDRFQLIVESLGPAAGDEFLQQVADRARLVLVDEIPLSSTSKANGLGLARLSRDQFGIIIDPVHTAVEAETVAERLLCAVQRPLSVGNRNMSSSITVGLATYQGQYLSAQEMVADAYTALYSAKALGAGRWMSFEPAMRELQNFRLQMDNDLRLVVEKHELEVYFQSRVHIGTGRICGFEALVRWNHPTRGIISPADFIPLAEENGVIHELGLWVLRRSCEQLQQWRRELSLQADFEVSVNLSAR
jgi:diguanylate cyclase (GGDEF)-like protein